MTYCNYKCLSTKSPVIQLIGYQEYAITNVLHFATRCTPRNKKPDNIEHTFSEPGSLFLKLPCHCTAYTDDEVLIDSVYPCSELYPDLDIVHTIPAIFSKDTSITNFRHRPFPPGSLEIFNNSYDLSQSIETIKKTDV
jgi:hypothetical protein